MVANYVGAYLLLGLVFAGILWQLGAKRLASKLIGLFLFAAAVANMVPAFLRWVSAVVPVIEIGFAVLVAVGIVVAGARFANHKRKLSAGAPKLSVKRRIEGD